MYDIVAGKQLVKKSYLLSKWKALEEFPMLKADKLCGALVYYDGKWSSRYCSLCTSCAIHEVVTSTSIIS